MVLCFLMGPNSGLHKAMGILAVVLLGLWFIEFLAQLCVLRGAYLHAAGWASLLFGTVMVGGWASLFFGTVMIGGFSDRRFSELSCSW